MKLTYGNPSDVGMSAEKITRLEALQKEWVEKGVSPIMVSLIARKGVIVSYKLFIDPDYNREYGPFGIDTIFQLASISKPVTATSIMLLAEEGKVSPACPVQDYLPEFTGKNKDKVLLHHLLTHTSGLDEEKLDEIFKSDNFSKDTADCPENQDPNIYIYLKAGCNVPLKTMPGMEMSYCGLGFNLLAEIVRRESSRNIDEFTTERIFEPLGMKDSFYIVPDEKVSRVAKHPANAPFPHFSDYERLKRPWGQGGLCSTAMDMAVFCQMLLNGGVYDGKRIMSKLSIDRMTTNQIPGVSSRYGDEFFKEACWGLGWNVSGKKQDYTGTLRSEKTFSHSGRGNTQIMVDPENELITINFQVTMKRINNRAYHNFEYFNDCALASIIDL